MALLNLVYHDQLFPRAAYRRSFEARSKPLISAPPVAAPSACWRWRTTAPCEAALAFHLEELLDRGTLPDLELLRKCFAPDPAALPETKSSSHR